MWWILYYEPEAGQLQPTISLYGPLRMGFWSLNGWKAKETILLFEACSLCEIQFPVPLGRFYLCAAGVLCMLSLGPWLSFYYSIVHDTCNAQGTCVWPPQEDLPLYVSSDHHVVFWSLISKKQPWARSSLPDLPELALRPTFLIPGFLFSFTGQHCFPQKNSFAFSFNNIGYPLCANIMLVE